jgi:putative membrane protein
MRGIIGAIVLLPVIFTSAAAHAWHPDAGWGYYLIGPLMWIVFIGLVVVLVVLVIRRLGGSGHFPAMLLGKTPLEILRERFARGEIGKEEFEERRRLLSE